MNSDLGRFVHSLQNKDIQFLTEVYVKQRSAPDHEFTSAVELLAANVPRHTDV